MTRAEFEAQAGTILERLLRDTGASRTTLRLDDSDLGFQVDDVVAEIRAPGQATMRGEGTIDHRAAQTAQWVERHRRLLVQDDVARSAFPPPVALMEGFGVKAQMLAPVQRAGRLEGWVSVHQAGATRHWSEADQRAAMATAHEIETMLGVAPDGGAALSLVERVSERTPISP